MLPEGRRALAGRKSQLVPGSLCLGAITSSAVILCITVIKNALINFTLSNKISYLLANFFAFVCLEWVVGKSTKKHPPVADADGD
jgi:hypothetical protein